MSNFTFTGTAQCDVCGAYLESSTAECDHDGAFATEHMFRHVADEEPNVVSVEATHDRKWLALQDVVEGNWVGYQYIGAKDTVMAMLTKGSWETVDDIPRIAMPMDAPQEAKEYVE